GVPQGRGTIVDDDTAAPSVFIGDATVREGSKGVVPGTVSTQMLFPVFLSSPSASPVTVDYITSDGTATNGLDYQPAFGTLTFAPGQTQATVTVPVLSDAVREGNEILFVNLRNASGAALGRAQGAGTIVDQQGVVFQPGPGVTIGDALVKE